MSLCDVSDDELMAEVSKRLGDGRMGYEGLFSPVQSGYRDLWTSLNLKVWERQNVDFAAWNPVVQLMQQLMAEPRRHFTVRGINTTEYGREAEIAAH